MRTVVYMLVIALLIIGGCSSGGGESFSRAGYNFSMVDKIAIVAIEGAVTSEPAKNQIADLFAMELLKKGFAPIERTQVKALLEEQQLPVSELTSEVGAAEAGKILNVPAVFIINIPHFGEETSITAKMVDVQEGTILWIGSGAGRAGQFLSTISFGALGTRAPVGSEEDELFGGVVGGVLGGAEDYVLSPQETEKAKRIIKRMCISLPSRLTTEW
jgi:hypothetical protein